MLGGLSDSTVEGRRNAEKQIYSCQEQWDVSPMST